LNVIGVSSFFSSRRRHTRCYRDWSSDVCSSDLTNVTTIGHIMGPRDLILHDAWIHNSALQGATLSGAHRLSFPHNDHEAADRILQDQRRRYERVLILLEGIYSMDGDLPDLAAFIDIKRRHDAILLVDEAHSIGVLGKNGRGIAEHCSIHTYESDKCKCTLSKTLCSCCALTDGPSYSDDYLNNLAPGF